MTPIAIAARSVARQHGRRRRHQSWAGAGLVSALWYVILDFCTYDYARGPGGGMPGGNTWVMVSMKRAVVAMAAIASAGVIGVAVEPTA